MGSERALARRQQSLLSAHWVGSVQQLSVLCSSCVRQCYLSAGQTPMTYLTTVALGWLSSHPALRWGVQFRLESYVVLFRCSTNQLCRSSHQTRRFRQYHLGTGPNGNKQGQANLATIAIVIVAAFTVVLCVAKSIANDRGISGASIKWEKIIPHFNVTHDSNTLRGRREVSHVNRVLWRPIIGVVIGTGRDHCVVCQHNPRSQLNRILRPAWWLLINHSLLETL